jgi:hypothetical protein
MSLANEMGRFQYLGPLDTGRNLWCSIYVTSGVSVGGGGETGVRAA